MRDHVREISHPRGDAGPKTEPGAFVATARATAIAAAGMVAAVIAIAAGTIDSSTVSWFPAPPELLARPKRSRLSNGLALTRGRPSAGARRVQRRVGRLSTST